ncbi:RluA family pseudouridine synthase [candidate division KSB1 bacterium]|nr:RluA family pseudouridine synthase [candidate division KSB1 bacterium]
MHNKIQQIIVSENKNKERLDIFLTRESSEFSRSQIQKMIKDGQVTINGKIIKPNYQIHPGDKIELHIPKPQKSIHEPENIPLDILYEDENLIIINKPAGMVVHPAYGNYQGTLVNALLYHSKNLSTLNSTERPGIVHRLDKNTSGLLVVAKDDFTHRHLSDQFANRTMEREYRAIVWGQPKPDKGEIRTFLDRNPNDRTRMYVPKNETGKLAITQYEIIEKFHLFSLLRLNLKTGRTHQIRVHLHHIGHPVLGDNVYDGRLKHTIPLNQADRQFAISLLKIIPYQALHALTLGFLHPVKNEFMRFQSDLPPQFSAVLNQIRQAAV